MGQTRVGYTMIALLCAGITSCAAVEVRKFPNPPVDPIHAGMDSAVFAGGCFWGVEGVFEALNGVQEVVSGYSGGSEATAHYELVGTGATGHAESVRVRYDASVISYGTLLKVFFSVAHNPTELNYQGPDHGTQYRSAVFYTSDEQKRSAEAYIAALDAAKVFSTRIVTEVTPLKAFYPAEDYHQDFMRLHPDNGYIQYWDKPKLEELKKQFPALLAKTVSSGSADLWYGYPVLAADSQISFPIVHSDGEWKKMLGLFAFSVLREAGTERAFSGKLNDEHRPGTFYSAATGQPLFRSEAKFDSGTGWPSFSEPMAADAIVLKWDLSYGQRVEVLDSSSGSHLGHVFDDGPRQSAQFALGTGLRFCMNSASMIFVADGDTPDPLVAAYLDK